MNISAVRAGLAARADTIGGLNALGYVPDSLPEPCFYPENIEIVYDRSYDRGQDDLEVTCRVLVSRADDKASQLLLDGYLSGSGASSIKAALEADETLGGACDDLRVTRAQGYRWYEHAGTKYIGAEWTVQVIGVGA